MKPATLPLALTFALIGSLQAVPMAKLTGDVATDFLTQYLTYTTTGNAGMSTAGTGYWVDASMTGTTASSGNIQVSITFTATGLAAGESLDFTDLTFDYTRKTLNGSHAEMMLFLDTGSGYGAPIIDFTEWASDSPQTDSFSVPTVFSLENGQSATFGFSFRDRHGLNTRIHLIQNFHLNGTFDLLSSTPGIDLNNNGVSDVWEYRFGAIELVKDEASKNKDYDGDGLTNYQESLAGTNPFDSSSILSLQIEDAPDNDLMLRVPTEAGKEYHIFGSNVLTPSSWSLVDPPFAGNGSDLELLVDPSNIDLFFYRAGVLDQDSDSDRLSAWEEAHLSGFLDTDPTSHPTDPTDDYKRLKPVIQSALESSISISSVGTTLFEKESISIPVTFTRVSPLGSGFLDLETTQTYQLVDTTRVASNAATSADYYLTDSNGTPLTDGLIVLPSGVSSTTIYVQPVNDGILESDEQLTLSVLGGESFNLWIADAQQVSSADYIAIAQAGHFLSQASMGGTPESISNLAREIQSQGLLPACEAWIDQQITLPRETTITNDCYVVQAEANLPAIQSVNIQNFELSWWGKMVWTKEQLRHRMAFALSQIFVTSSAFWSNQERNNIWESYTRYYDKLTDAAFTSHRALLTEISYDPFMGVYLSSAQNRKADLSAGTAPDENYAREVMQLFSCGVYEQTQRGEYVTDGNGNRIENYDNGDITELAQVFTGLGLTSEAGVLYNFDNPSPTVVTRFRHPMTMSQTHHDESSKVLLYGPPLPAGQAGDLDISQALDRLALHPSTAPFLTRLLIQRLTNSNPSGDYIERVVQAWNGTGPYAINGEVGNFVSILKAILLDDEVRNSITFEVDPITDVVTAVPAPTSSVDNGSTGGRMKEPIIKWTQFYRFSQAISSNLGEFPRFPALTKKAANDQTPDFGQIPMRAPSVFNYYSFEYSPSLGSLADAETTYGTNLVSPESEILSPYVIRQFEAFLEIVNDDAPVTAFSFDGRVDYRTEYNYLRYLYAKNETVADFIDDVNLWLCNGQISPALKQEFVTIANNNGGATRKNLATILTIIFNSSDFSIAL